MKIYLGSNKSRLYIPNKIEGIYDSTAYKINNVNYLKFSISGQLDATYDYDNSYALIGDRNAFGTSYGIGNYIVSQDAKVVYDNGHLIVEGDLYEYEDTTTQTTSE